jgi:hypothetical protein
MRDALNVMSWEQKDAKGKQNNGFGFCKPFKRFIFDRPKSRCAAPIGPVDHRSAID